MTMNEIAAICGRNGLALNESQEASLARYTDLLLEWNAKVNLISRKDEAHTLDRHILHSLTLAMPDICTYDFLNKRVLDLGTGGGLPGIPLTIAIPSLDMTLVDSIQKKIAACNAMIEVLSLTG